jgi:septin family protein
VLESLHQKCNIIPVIAKGDSYTTEEVIELKKNILSKAKFQWFNVEEYIRLKYP